MVNLIHICEFIHLTLYLLNLTPFLNGSSNLPKTGQYTYKWRTETEYQIMFEIKYTANKKSASAKRKKTYLTH